MSTGYNKNYILELFDNLDKIPNDWEENKVFVDGEFDSNQSKFEKMSNQCQIGTLAKSEIVGKALLAFLRIIIDKHDVGSRINDVIFMVYDCSEEEIKIDYNIDTVIKFLADSEDDYTEFFDYDKPITAKLSECRDGIIYVKHINEKADDMNLWNISRIKDRILSLY